MAAQASVLIKWFHSDGESELEEARALRSASVTGELDAHMLDLASYEVGNVLTRTLRWTAADVAASWAAAAVELGIPLISADRRLLVAGLAESPSEITKRLKLTLN